MSGAAIIVAAKRSIVAPRGGALGGYDLPTLAAPVLRACLHDAELQTDVVDEVVLSNAMGGGGNPARLVALAAGLEERVAGLSIDRQCCGGLDAILQADALIRAGQADVVITGGAESYSRRPIRMTPGTPPVPYDRPPFSPWPDRDPEMAEAANALAGLLGISRARQDAWAIASHCKARAAKAALAGEIVSVGDETATDPFTRQLTPRLCARARAITGTITSANMAVAADAAAFCLVVSKGFARRRNLRGIPIIAGVTQGAAPELPGLAPVAAIAETLERAELVPTMIGSAEIMEAFAVQAIACVEGAGLAPEVVNRRGGMLARGHPIGASGAVLAVRLFADLRTGPGPGLAAIAGAGGLATAIVLGSPQQ